MVQAISKITLYVDSQEEAETFWTKQMGFCVTEKQPMGPGLFWLEVAPAAGGTSFVLYSREAMKRQNPGTSLGHPSVILSTGNLERDYEVLKQKNVRVDELLELPYGKMTTFYDHENNPYLLREDAAAR